MYDANIKKHKHQLKEIIDLLMEMKFVTQMKAEFTCGFQSSNMWVMGPHNIYIIEKYKIYFHSLYPLMKFALDPMVNTYDLSLLLLTPITRIMGGL